MTLYFFLSLIIFSVIDMFYIYNLLDDFFLYSSQGSKLKKYVNNINIKRKNKTNYMLCFKSLFKSKKVLIMFVLTYIALFILNISILYKFLNSSLVIVKIFSKTIDLVSSYGSLFNTVKFFYIISYMLFLAFILFQVFKKVFKTKKDITVDNMDSLQVNIGKYLDNVDSSNNDTNCIITEKGLFQNILITGSIGSGKTSSAIYTILNQLIAQNLGGLILDVKGNLKELVSEILEANNRLENLKVITVDGKYLYNPLNNDLLSAGEISNRLKNVLTLISENNNSDSYWLDKAATTIECFIIICRIYGKKVNFYEINKLVSDTNYLNECINKIKEKVLSNSYDEEKLFIINYAINYIKNEYLNLDSRVISIIKSEITRITSPFISDYRVYNSFCESNKEKFQFNLESNDIVLLSIDMSKYKYVAKIISTYLKQDFQTVVLSKISNNNPIFFISDEYQEFATKDDANFLSLSREAKCINVISMQSYSSLRNTLKSEDTTRIIIQNCINKIWFRNDDIFTIEEIIKQIGKCDISKETMSYSENAKRTNYSMISNKFKNLNTNISEGYSISRSREYRYDERFFTQELKTFEALAFISNGKEVFYPEKIILKRGGLSDVKKS